MARPAEAVRAGRGKSEAGTDSEDPGHDGVHALGVAGRRGGIGAGQP